MTDAENLLLGILIGALLVLLVQHFKSKEGLTVGQNLLVYQNNQIIYTIPINKGKSLSFLYGNYGTIMFPRISTSYTPYKQTIAFTVKDTKGNIDSFNIKTNISADIMDTLNKAIDTAISMNAKTGVNYFSDKSNLSVSVTFRNTENADKFDEERKAARIAYAQANNTPIPFYLSLDL